MIIVGIDSSSKTGSCAVIQNDKILAQGLTDNGLTHSQTLLPMIMDTLKSAGAAPEQVELYAVTVGPGSFTGLRIGIATVTGLAAAYSTKCVGVSSLEAAAVTASGDGIVCAVMDARCGQVYNALFEKRGNVLVRLCEDRTIKIDELKKYIESCKNPIKLVGDGAVMCYNKYSTDLLVAEPSPDECYVHGSAVAALGKLYLSRADSAAALRAQYIQLPQAQRELLERKKGQII